MSFGPEPVSISVRLKGLQISSQRSIASQRPNLTVFSASSDTGMSIAVVSSRAGVGEHVGGGESKGKVLLQRSDFTKQQKQEPAKVQKNKEFEDSNKYPAANVSQPEGTEANHREIEWEELENQAGEAEISCYTSGVGKVGEVGYESEEGVDIGERERGKEGIVDANRNQGELSSVIALSRDKDMNPPVSDLEILIVLEERFRESDRRRVEFQAAKYTWESERKEL